MVAGGARRAEGSSGGKVLWAESGEEPERVWVQAEAGQGGAGQSAPKPGSTVQGGGSSPLIISSAEKVRTQLLVTHLREDHSGGLFSWSHSDRRWICPGVGRKGGEGGKWGLRWIRDRGRRLARVGPEGAEPLEQGRRAGHLGGGASGSCFSPRGGEHTVCCY